MDPEETSLNEKTVHFRWLSEFLDEGHYSNGSSQWLEHAKQSLEDSSNFPLMNRDFCMLRQSSKEPWRTPQESLREGFTIEIFHTDTVKMAPEAFELKDDTSRRYWYDGAQAEYAVWQYQGVTRTFVEKLLEKHYNASLSLEKQSPAVDLMPAARQYVVEVKPNVWEPRVVLFFGEDFDTSKIFISELGSGRRKLVPMKRILGEKYSELIQSRWSVEDLEIVKGISVVLEHGKELAETTKATESESMLQASDDEQRQISANVTAQTSDERTTPLMDQTRFDRGRLKRRERRKKNGDNGLDQPDGHNLNAGMTQADSKGSSPTGILQSTLDTNTGIWRYDKQTTPYAKIAVTIDFPDSDESNLGNQPNVTPNDNDIESGVRIHFKSLLSPSKEIKKRIYRLYSYCQQCYRHAYYHSQIQDVSGQVQSVVTLCKNHDVYIGEVHDELGLFQSGTTYSISVLEAEVFKVRPTTISPIIAAASNEFVDALSNKVRDGYWPKFSLLLEGAKEFRYIHYSMNNFYLTIHHHKQRYGELDPDNLSNEGEDCWRANWTFDFYDPAMQSCKCSTVKDHDHDINSHHYIARDAVNQFGTYASRSGYRCSAADRRDGEDEILRHLYHYTSLPPEVLQRAINSLHVYVPPSDQLSSYYYGPEGGEEAWKLEQEEKKREQDELEIVTCKAKGADRAFELGVCYVMGLGFIKDIRKGLESIRFAAEEGSSRARIVYLPLCNAYEIEDEDEDHKASGWFVEEFRNQSDPEFLLNRVGSDIVKTVREDRSLQFYLDEKRIIDYKKDIAPFYDMENPTLLLQQVASTGENTSSADENSDSDCTSESSLSKDAVYMFKQVEPDYAWGKRGPEAFTSLLHTAALFGFQAAVSALLEADFDVDARSGFDIIGTPLLCALYRNHPSIAKLLIEKGASCEPALTWARVGRNSFAGPSPLHYLVYIDKASEATKLARTMVKKGSDVNFKCSLKSLPHESFLGMCGRKESVTPLRWAVIHEKPQLVRTLLSLGAKFARKTYFKSVPGEEAEDIKKVEGNLLLETPSTNLEIIEMFFARARVPGISKEFCETPLGLLVCEYDGPQRRLRRGFENWDKVEDALSLLLDLQPGCEDILLYSAVRFGHVDISRHLLLELEWSTESRYKGLTCLHIAALYGNLEMVAFLLSIGADKRARTEERHLTCYHLLMMVPRDEDTLRKMLDLFLDSEIDVDAKECISSLTALHLAVRNRNLYGVEWLLSKGVNKCAPVADQLELLSEGIRGYLKGVEDRPQLFSKDLTILGEAIIQFIEGGVYRPNYIAHLIHTFMRNTNGTATLEDLLIDPGPQITLLHLLATIPFHPNEPNHSEGYTPNTADDDMPIPVEIDPSKIPYLQLILNHTPISLLNTRDLHGDTPLHYACAARQLHAIKSLISSGADIHAKNDFGLRPIDTLCWAGIFAGGADFRIENDKGVISYLGFENEKMKEDERRSAVGSEHPDFDLSEVFDIFEKLDCVADGRVRKLAEAWGFAAGSRWDVERGFVLRDGDGDGEGEGVVAGGDEEMPVSRYQVLRRVEGSTKKLWLDGAHYY